MENNQTIYPCFSEDFKDSNPTFIEPCFSEPIKPEIKQTTPQIEFTEPNHNIESNPPPKQEQNNEKNSLLSSLLPLLLSNQNSNSNAGFDISSILKMTNGSSGSSSLIQSLLASGDLFKQQPKQESKPSHETTNQTIDVSKLTKIDI